MMRFVLLALSALVAASWAETLQEPNAFGYHSNVGLKEAERILNAELQVFSGQQEGRIVGGAIAPINSHPYLAGLIIDLVGVAGNSVCGGSLLTANRVLTAAHCWFDGANQAWRFTVVLGSQFLFLGGGTRIPTSQVALHPQWTPSTIAQDVAMIYLPSNVLFTATIYPISLPSGTALWEDFTGTWMVAVGYGRTSDLSGLTTSTLVSQVALQVISNAQCQATYGVAMILNSNICTSGVGSVGICAGDSGGPLLTVRNGAPMLVGVSSFVARDGCQLGHPSAFARVTSFLDFVYQHL